MTTALIRHLGPLLASVLGVLVCVAPARAEVLFTFGEMMHLQGLPLESACPGRCCRRP